MDLGEVWRIREEDVYPRIFGNESKGIFVIDVEMLAGFGVERYDARWLNHGVIQFSPTSQRSSWLYVTSGLSNPWHTQPSDFDTTGISGTGVEFVLQTHVQADWAFFHLRNVLAFELMLNAGRFPGKGLILPGDRIPLRGPINGDTGSSVDTLLATDAEGIPGEFLLPSGNVEFQSFTGKTQREVAHAKAGKTEDLLRRLRAVAAHPVTLPDRDSVV